MTKLEIVREITLKTGLDPASVSKIIEALMVSIKENMIDGNNIYFRGFGSFVLTKRAEKKGRNITKSTVILIPAHTVPTFKPCAEFESGVKAKATIQQIRNRT